jgi:hypothetical protein
MFQEDVLERLRMDPGQRTLGQLLQDREAAAHEIRKLRAAVSKGKLRLESNSVQRADTLRRQVESACGGLLRHRGRNHSDPRSERVRAGYGAASTARDADEELPPAEALTTIRQFKAQHYADWPNQPLPALGGKAPRDAVKTKAGKAAVDPVAGAREINDPRIGS